MKALGIPQPGAWLVINGYHARVPLPKPTRGKSIVLIYALSNPVSAATFQQFVAGCKHLNVMGHPLANDFELGGFLGTARLTACETDDPDAPVAVVESPDELGFIPAPGRLGVFNVSNNPFAVNDIPRPIYVSGPLAPRTTSEQIIIEDSDSDEPSLLDHFLDGVQSQVQRELHSVGRKAAKDAMSITADLLTGWLGGGKPRGRRR